jgi:FMN-dependent NADH-azoreductase
MHTNIDIPDEVANELFRRAPQQDVRFALLERILKEYFESHPVSKRVELDLINENVDELNREATDVLDYQIIP